MTAIVLLRIAFQWGTGRISQVLRSPPEYLLPILTKEAGSSWIGCKLSRVSVNNVLKEARINGSPYGKSHEWKYFRANRPDELWQIDIKGPVLLDGKRVRILVVLDDYSRYLVRLKIFDHDPTTKEVQATIDEIIAEKGRSPEKTLTDNGHQFRNTWDGGCENRKIESVHSHPHYPQDKGKVERVIRTLNEEFLRLDRHIPAVSQYLDTFREWYNSERFHMGVNDFPSQLYFGT